MPRWRYLHSETASFCGATSYPCTDLVKCGIVESTFLGAKVHPGIVDRNLETISESSKYQHMPSGYPACNILTPKKQMYWPSNRWLCMDWIMHVWLVWDRHQTDAWMLSTRCGQHTSVRLSESGKTLAHFLTRDCKSFNQNRFHFVQVLSLWLSG